MRSGRCRGSAARSDGAAGGVPYCVQTGCPVRRTRCRAIEAPVGRRHSTARAACAADETFVRTRRRSSRPLRPRSSARPRARTRDGRTHSRPVFGTAARRASHAVIPRVDAGSSIAGVASIGGSCAMLPPSGSRRKKVLTRAARCRVLQPGVTSSARDHRDPGRLTIRVAGSCRRDTESVAACARAGVVDRANPKLREHDDQVAARTAGRMIVR